MTVQMQLLLKLSNASASDDTEHHFYEKEIKPLLKKLKADGVVSFNFRNLLGDTIPHICVNNRLNNTLKSIHEFCEKNFFDLNLNLKDEKIGQTPISIAAYHGDKALVEWFLKTPKTRLQLDALYSTKDNTGKLPVWYAAYYYSKIDPVDENGAQSPYREEAYKLVELLDCPKNVLKHERDQFGITAVDVLKRANFYDVCSEFFSDYTNSLYQDALIVLALEYNAQVLEQYLASHPFSYKQEGQYQQDNYGRTALAYSCEKGDATKVTCLLSYANKQVNLSDNQGQSPLHFAVLSSSRNPENGRLIIDHLLKNGAQNSPNKAGLTPAEFAKLIGLTEISELILKTTHTTTADLDKPAATFVPRFNPAGVASVPFQQAIAVTPDILGRKKVRIA